MSKEGKKMICATFKCGKEFIKTGKNHQYCSLKCRKEAWYAYEFKSDRLKEKEAIVLTDRDCLGCGKSFKSEGIHNRMCALCRRREGIYGQENYSFGKR